MYFWWKHSIVCQGKCLLSLVLLKYKMNSRVSRDDIRVNLRRDVHAIFELIYQCSDRNTINIIVFILILLIISIC